MCWAMSAEAPQTEHLKLSEQDVAYLVGRGGHTRMRLERFSYTRLEISRDGAEIEGTAHQRAQDVSRGTSFGNPVALPYGTHNRTAYGTAVEAFDTICEYVTENAVGGPLPQGLVAQSGRIHQHQLRVTRRELDKALWRTAGSVSRDGASYALRCRN